MVVRIKGLKQVFGKYKRVCDSFVLVLKEETEKGCENMLSASMVHECRRLALNYLSDKKLKPVFITISGSHLYGWDSESSDIDIRCCHIGDSKSFFHLSEPKDMYDWKQEVDGKKVEFESMEIKKVISLAYKNNSNILEHIFATNLLDPPPREYNMMRELAAQSISKIVYEPYHGMAEYNYRKFIESLNPSYEPQVTKKYLYVMRAYLVGAEALRSGKIIPEITHHLSHAEEDVRNAILELLMRKKNGNSIISADDHKRYREIVAKLSAMMEISLRESSLKEKPETLGAWDDFLYNIRLKYI